MSSRIDRTCRRGRVDPKLGAGLLELAAGDAGRGIRAVRRRPVALHPRRPWRATAWAGCCRGRSRSTLVIIVSRGGLRSAAAERAGTGDDRASRVGCSSRGATGSTGIARRSSRNPPMQRVRLPRAAADSSPMHYDLAMPVTERQVRQLRINDTVTLQRHALRHPRCDADRAVRPRPHDALRSRAAMR